MNIDYRTKKEKAFNKENYITKRFGITENCGSVFSGKDTFLSCSDDRQF